MIIKTLCDYSEEEGNAYVNELMKIPKEIEETDEPNYWFPTPEQLGNVNEHTPIQARILRELQELQEIEKLDPTKDEISRQTFLEKFKWDDSLLHADERKLVEEVLV